MTYVFDTNIFITLFSNYYRDRFPSLWVLFDEMIDKERITSTREALREIEDRNVGLFEWAQNNQHIFTTPNAKEGAFVAKIYKVTHFQQNIERQKILQGGKNADPFIIARAAVEGYSIVTTEIFKSDAVKVPNICKHFDIKCLNLENFMKAENWKF